MSKLSPTPSHESVADMIPKWFEGGTQDQMLDEALAQIRKIEGERDEFRSALATALGKHLRDISAPSETPRNIHGSSSCEEMESMYHKVVMVALECDPIPACKREDDRIEPPWEVFARIKRELNAMTLRCAAADRTANAALSAPSAIARSDLYPAMAKPIVHGQREQEDYRRALEAIIADPEADAVAIAHAAITPYNPLGCRR